MSGLTRKIELDTMKPEEGAEFLLRRAGIITEDATLDRASTTDRAAAVDILRAMGGLPLALDQAGAYIEETNESVSNYLPIYQRQRAELLNRRGGLVSDHPESVATTWSLAFERVERANPAATELMRFCAFLAPDTIPEELIIEGASHLGLVLQPVAANRNRLNAALVELLKYSLIRRDSGSQTLTIHRLVQAVIKDEMDKKTQRRWAQRAVRATRQVFPFGEPAPWLRSQRYLPHVLICEEHIKQWNLTLVEAANLLNNAGTYLKNRGQYREAEPLQQYALSIGETLYGRDHPNTTFLLHNLANLYSMQGRNEETLPLYQRALAIYEKVFGPDHRHTKGVREDYTNLLKKMGQKTGEVDQQN